MTQKIEIVSFSGTDTLKIFPLDGLDTAAYTSTSVTAFTNDVNTFSFDDIPLSHTGYFRAVAFAGTTVKAKGFVDLTGTASIHYVETSLASLKILRWTANNAVAAAIATAPAITTLEFLRGDTIAQSIELDYNLTGWTKILFTCKFGLGNEDEAAEIQISKTAAADTLEYITAREALATETGSITIDDLTAGDITVNLNAVASANLRKCSKCRDGEFDVQVHKGAAVYTPKKGIYLPTYDVSRAVA